ncbi:MAG: MFS transporter, partial [Pseudomonadota bacterium]
GFVAGCLFAPYLIMRAGHIRAFAAMVSCVSAAALAFPLLVGEVQWIIFRFAIGVCISGVLVIIESWLNEKSNVNTRGAVMSTYIIISYGGITLGQLGVTTQPLSGFALFSICSILLSIAAVPVALTRASQPAPIPQVHFRPKRLWSLAPAAFVGALMSGILTGSVLTLSAVYAVGSGFSTNEAAFFASAIVLGGALGQYPFGRTSDFVDRRFVLLAAASASVALAGILALGPIMPPMTVLVFGLVLGFVMLPTYSLAAAHAYDWTEYEDMVETSAGMNLLFGVGSTMGPVIASLAMQVFGASGLFVVVAAAAGTLVAFLLLRIVRRAPPEETQRSEFDIYATAPVGAVVPEADLLPPEDEPATTADLPNAPHINDIEA